MLRLRLCQRRAIALVLGFMVLSVSAAMANTPAPGDKPGVTLDVNPSDGVAPNQSVHVTGTGWPQSVGLNLCATVTRIRDIRACTHSTIVQATPSADGTFAIDVTFPTTYHSNPDQADLDVAVDCLKTQCFVDATDFAGTAAQHHINFQGGLVFTPTTTTSSTTAAPTSSTTSTTSEILRRSTTTAGAGTTGDGQTGTTGGGQTATTAGTPTRMLSADPTTTSPAAATQAVGVPAALARTGAGAGRLSSVAVALVLLGTMILIHGRRPPAGDTGEEGR